MSFRLCAKQWLESHNCTARRATRTRRYGGAGCMLLMDDPHRIGVVNNWARPPPPKLLGFIPGRGPRRAMAMAGAGTGTCLSTRNYGQTAGHGAQLLRTRFDFRRLGISAASHEQNGSPEHAYFSYLLLLMTAMLATGAGFWRSKPDMQASARRAANMAQSYASNCGRGGPEL